MTGAPRRWADGSQGWDIGMSAKRILVVDDDDGIRELLSAYLGQVGFQLETAASGRQMWQVLARQKVDLVILDLMMPGEDGLALCGQLRREQQVAIIILTARDDATDRVVGLELGADDYVTKPFDPRELLARVRAVLRRWGEQEGVGNTRQEYVFFSGWRLDVRARQMLSPEGVVISLPGSDFHVLRLLLEHANQALSRDFLLRQVFGRRFEPHDRAIDVCISRLRQHLEPDPRQPTLIRTLRNEGYVLFHEDADHAE